MTWLGLRKGMGGSDIREGSLEKNGGINELTKRLSHMRMIWGAVSKKQSATWLNQMTHMFPAPSNDMLACFHNTEENQRSQLGSDVSPELDCKLAYHDAVLADLNLSV